MIFAGRSAQSLVRRFLSPAPVRYLLVGGVAFLVDFGLLGLLHALFAVPLVWSTPIAFLASLTLTFAMQRAFTFRTGAGVAGSAVRYGLLVAFNTAATTVIVTGGVALGMSWEWAKALAVATTVFWNYFGYRYWIFPAAKNGDQRSRRSF